MSAVIWHNPRCSKSRATLALLNKQGIAVEVRRYLEDVPTKDELWEAVALLGIEASALVRRGEAAYQSAGLSPSSSDEEVLAAMVNAPILIQRPIVFANGKAAIGRPPEAVLTIL